MRKAFTLLEVMFAILILGVGLIAVAGLFPIAGAMQRSTVDVVHGMNILSSVDAMLQEKGINKALLDPMLAASGTNYYRPTDAQLVTLGIRLRDRAYPSSVVSTDANNDGVAEDTDGNGIPNGKNSYYWRPMFRKDATGHYSVFIFVMARITNDEPRVLNTGQTLAGDLTLSPTGTVSKVIFDTANDTNWHAETLGSRSSLVHMGGIGAAAVR